MSIRPVVLNGMIQRTDDVGQMKQNEMHKPIVDQQNGQHMVQKKEEAASQTVIHPDKNEKLQNHTDAREEGKGFYYQSKSSKKKKKVPEEGIVKKKENPSGGFDMKV